MNTLRSGDGQAGKKIEKWTKGVGSQKFGGNIILTRCRRWFKGATGKKTDF